jgi:hypothetical protein
LPHFKKIQKKVVHNYKASYSSMVAFFSQSVFASLLMSLAFHMSTAQLVDGSCACQPVAFELVFDFSSNCEDSDFSSGSPGIEEFTCNVEPPDLADMSPTKVTQVTITEVDENNQPINEQEYTGEFQEGESLFFNSSIADGMSEIPRGLTVVMIGESANGTEIINLWVMLFSGSCEEYPIIQEGNKAGWTTFVSLMHVSLMPVKISNYYHLMLYFQVFRIRSFKRCLLCSDEANIAAGDGCSRCSAPARNNSPIETIAK